MKDSLSEVQKKDVQALLSVNYDREYLHLWISKLELTQLLEQVQNA
jgi:hypothetical protein